MGNLRHKVTGLQARFYCPIHRDEVLICSECDLLDLPDAEWDELIVLIEQAGYLDRTRDRFESAGVCWRCSEGDLYCPQCANDREAPLGIALMNDAAIDRLHKLADAGGEFCRLAKAYWLIGIGRSLAAPLLPHHRTWPSNTDAAIRRHLSFLVRHRLLFLLLALVLLR